MRLNVLLRWHVTMPFDLDGLNYRLRKGSVKVLLHLTPEIAGKNPSPCLVVVGCGQWCRWWKSESCWIEMRDVFSV